MKSAYDKIAAGLDDAIAYMQGDASRGRLATGVDVKAIRAANNMTQDAFARAFHLPIGTVRDWEQGRRQPDSGSRILLRMIAADARSVERIMAKLD